MTETSAISDSIDALRVTGIFEFSFGVSVANLTIQLSYGVDLFWPLTTDDLKPYTHYFSNQDETLYKLLETFILSLTALYGVNSLLRYSIYGLVINLLVFFIHSSISLLGLVIVGDHKVSLLSLEFFTWLASIAIEILTVVTTTYLLLYYGSLIGFAGL